jgi:hypothetical protein
MDKYDEIVKLKGLFDSGAITQAEFEEQKSRLLNQFSASNNSSYLDRDATPANEIVNKLASMELTHGIIWAVIAAIQIIGGLLLGFWQVAICGGYNVYSSYSTIKRSGAVKQPYPGMVDEYKNELVSIIIFIGINIAIGGVIGVAGCLFSLYIRNYVIKNEKVLSQLGNAVSLET